MFETSKAPIFYLFDKDITTEFDRGDFIWPEETLTIRPAQVAGQEIPAVITNISYGLMNYGIDMLEPFLLPSL